MGWKAVMELIHENRTSPKAGAKELAESVGKKENGAGNANAGNVSPVPEPTGGGAGGEPP
jgi:hypothetical protein